MQLNDPLTFIGSGTTVNVIPRPIKVSDSLSCCLGIVSGALVLRLCSLLVFDNKQSCLEECCWWRNTQRKGAYNRFIVLIIKVGWSHAVHSQVGVNRKGND